MESLVTTKLDRVTDLKPITAFTKLTPIQIFTSNWRKFIRVILTYVILLLVLKRKNHYFLMEISEN